MNINLDDAELTVLKEWLFFCVSRARVMKQVDVDLAFKLGIITELDKKQFEKNLF